MTYSKERIMQEVKGIPLMEADLRLLLIKYKGQKILFRRGEASAEPVFMEVDATTAMELEEFKQRFSAQFSGDPRLHKISLCGILGREEQGGLTYGNAVVVGAGKRRFLGLGKTGYFPIVDLLFREADKEKQEILLRTGAAARDILSPGMVIDGQNDSYTICGMLHHQKRVHKATSNNTGLEMAVKMYSRDSLFSEQRFVREKIIQEKLQAKAAPANRNILYMVEAVDHEAEKLIISPYVKGGDLGQLMKWVCALKPKEINALISGICDGLEHLHSLEIIHRDIKLQNVLLEIADPAYTKVTKRMLLSNNLVVPKIFDFDYGYHKDTKKCEEAGVAVGTPCYMAPEIVRGDIPDSRADIYSTGVLIYSLLTKTFPFNGRNTRQVMQAHLSNPVPNPQRFNPDITKSLLYVIEKALAKDPDKRYQTARELEEAWLNTA